MFWTLVPCKHCVTMTDNYLMQKFVYKNICINVCIIKIHVPRAHEVQNQRVIAKNIYDMEYAELFSKQYRQCVDRNDFDMYINI